jgi:hypothetical protein
VIRLGFILHDIVILAITCEIRKPNLTARLANARGHDAAFLPDVLAVSGRYVLVVQSALDRTAVVEDWEVILAVAVEVCESDLVAVFSDAGGDGAPFFSDYLAFAYRGKHTGVEVRLDISPMVSH